MRELSPFQDDILEVPGKRGFNAFINTNLDEILKQRDISHLVIAGAVTSICIDSTGRSAHEKGYRVSVLSDCTSARTTFEQSFYLEDVFPLYAETLTAGELLESLNVTALC
ncbi:MAG: cysteine hydrolase family protein [Phormidesmis sp.]